jgi:hypothetical protein
VGATVTTSGTTNECTIIDSVRAYDTGGEILGANIFTIELYIKQVVYATSSNTLTLEDVTTLVENGFNRGRGGRVQFRTLLAESLAFLTVLDVEVLDKLGPPQLAPTVAPTSISPPPTKQPTLPPILEPTVSPTRSATAHPSAASSQVPSGSQLEATSTFPSSSPNVLPSLVPSVTPSEEIQMAEFSSKPSSAPSIVGAAVVTSEKTPPYVIAAITIGASSVLMACCCSVFLCRKKQQNAKDQQNLLPNDSRGSNEDDSPPPRRDHGKKAPSTPSTPAFKLQGRSALPIVPDMVRLDDEHRSLAETTLGEYTAGRKPPRKKRLVEMDVTANSFEDESLYTTIGIIPRIQPGRRIDEDDDDKKTKDRKKIRSPPTLSVGATVFDDDIFFQMSDTGSSSQEGSSLMSPSSPMSAKIAGLIAAELGTVAPGDPEALPSRFRSNYTESRDDVDGMIGANGMIGVSPWLSQQVSTRSPSSSLGTKKTDNVAAIFALARSNDEEDPWTVDAPGIYERSGSSSLLRRKKPLDEKSHASRADSVKSRMQVLATLQESPDISENTQSMMQLLEEEDRMTSVSPISMQLWEEEDNKPSVLPDDGDPPDGVEGNAAHRFVSPYKTRYLLGLQSPTPQRELRPILPSDGKGPPAPLMKNTRPDPEPMVSIVDPLKPRNDSPPPGRNLRHHTLESPPHISLATGDISVLTSESSDASGNGEDRWLFRNVTQTLGPRSTSADMESLSGKSHKSSKSWRSQRSSKSLGSRRPRKRKKGSSVGSRGNHRGSFSFGSPADISLVPRSLENDLMRLELQVASLKSTDPSKEPMVSPSPHPPGVTSGSDSVGSKGTFSNKKVSSKQRIIVVAPPGKLGVILANRHNGTGTVVSELRGSSPLRGALLPGDKLRTCV